MKINSKLLLIMFSIFPLFFAGTTKAQESSSEADSVLQKVKQKIETLKKNPKAYIGTITDKTDTSLQIKDVQGKIELVSVLDTTHYSKIDSRGETDIKFTDIAIDDYISALGTFGSAEVLNARRVILSSPITDDRKIMIGEIKGIVNKTATIEVDDEELVLTFPSRWKGPEIKELAVGNKVAIVAIVSDSKYTVRTIEILN